MKLTVPLKIGAMYPTNNSGYLTVIEYVNTANITVRFNLSGTVLKARKANILRGGVTDYRTCFKNNKKLYGVWNSMRDRCFNTKSVPYKDYGGRGIRISPEWREFYIFCIWAENNGYRESLTIDRRDNDGNYSPENCRWVDMRTQSRNRSNNSKFGPCIYQQPGSENFIVRIYHNYVLHNLGTFSSIEEATDIRDNFMSLRSSGGYSN